MELTNFIWHLGAALAAVWAALAYRSVKRKTVELEHGVLASLLAEEVTSEGQTSSGLAQIRRRNAARVRALRWFADEFSQVHDVRVQYANRQALLELSHSEWCLAAQKLYSMLINKAFSGGVEYRPCQLTWSGVGANGQWVVECEKERQE